MFLLMTNLTCRIAFAAIGTLGFTLTGDNILIYHG